jgi:hypothetical protein
MGFSSQAGQVILRNQAVAGTYQADTGTAGIGMRLRSGVLAPSRELMIPDPEIGGNRDVPDALLGAVSFGGDYEFYTRVDSLATLLSACLGTPAVVTATGVSTVTYTPSDAAQLPFLSIEEKVGAGLECFNYTDAVVNTLHLEADANGYCQGTAGIIAKKQEAGKTPTAAPVWDVSPLLVGTNITLTYNAVTLAAKSFSLDINNNFEDDDFRLGSFFLGDLSPKRREVNAGFTIREQDSSKFRQAVYGIPSATTPGGVTTKNELVITISSYDVIEGGTPATPYSLTFTIPKFILAPYSFGVSGDDIIDDDISGSAVRPDSATPIMTVVAKTGLTDVA